MADADIERYLKLWSLQIDGERFGTPTSWIQPVRRSNTPAILKLLKPNSDEGNAAELLRYYDGRGAVVLFEADAIALLMERATGQRSLSTMASTGQDTEAAEVLADTVARLHGQSNREAPRSLTPLKAQFSALFEHAGTNATLRRCAEVARRLLATEKDITPLHGDLHHDNVLDGSARGWLAIDPKALIGERSYEIANLLCNPRPHGNLVHNQDRMNRLARFYARRLGFNAQRILDFAFAHAGLSACWHMEDGEDPDYSLKCVEVLAPLVDG